MKKIILFIFCLSLLIGRATFSDTWYVDNSVGSSGNGQSWGTAWKNLSDISWGSISGSDTIEVSGGASSQTYNEQLSPGASGSIGNYITIKTSDEPGYDGTVNIRQTTQEAVYVDNIDYVIIDGFDISTTGVGNHGVFVRGGSTYITLKYLTIHDYCGLGIAGYIASYVTVQYCEIYDPDLVNGNDPMQIGPTDHWTIEHNTIRARFPTNGQHFDCIQLSEPCTDLVIRYNIFGNANTASVYLETLSGWNHTVWIYGNIFNVFSDPNMSDSDSFWGIFGDGSPGTIEAYIYNNTFINLCNNVATSGRGIRLDNSSSGQKVVIKNNIFYNSRMEITENWGGSDANTQSDYNCFWMPSGFVLQWDGTEYSGVPYTPFGWSEKDTNSIVDNPDLLSVSTTNSDSHDMHLTAASPVIGQGVNVGISTDYDGEDYDSPPSMGAYEYQAGDINFSIGTTLRFNAIWQAWLISGLILSIWFISKLINKI